MSGLKRFVAIDPGHFHAALVQRRSYPGVDSVAKVFAPGGAELDSHLRLVEAFNLRADDPTMWREDVYCGDDYIARFSAAAETGELGDSPIAVLAGRNDRKGEYALAAVEAGCHVLADKPLAVTPDVFEQTERAARLAQERGLCFADIMTERHEATSILQRALAMDVDLYGEQEKGSPDDPAVVEASVHHFCKFVNGVPLRRPEWYYDTKVQGDGIVDVTSHLVDLVQWKLFPGARLSKCDVDVLSARSWPTVVMPEQFRMSTGGDVTGPLTVNANGEFTWRLRGVHCKAAVEWNFIADEGAGDTHCSVMRGTRAEVVVRQGAAEDWRPVLYVRSRGDASATRKALSNALAGLSKRWPGVSAEPTDEAGVWRVVRPEGHDEGHEAHFGEVVRSFLGWVDRGMEDPTYVDNMLVKYHTIVEAWKMSRGV